MKTFKATNRYRETVIVFEIIENMARTSKGMYHVTKLFVNGKSLNPA